MKTKMMTKVILTVFTLALGIRPLEEALRDSGSSALFAELLAAEALVCMALPFFQMVQTMTM